MSHCGVSSGWLEPSETWDVELKGNTAPNSRPRGLLTFCFYLCDENRVMFMLLFVFNKKWSTQCQSERLGWEVCMWKTNGLYVMLGTTRTWTARTLDVFLELKLRSTPAAVLSYDSLSRPSCILWEDLFSFFVFHFPGHFWKTHLGSGKAGWQMITICQRPHYSKQHKLCLETSVICLKKGGWGERGGWECKGGGSFGKCRSSRASIGLMASRTFLFPTHFCLHVRGKERWDADLDVHARCFLSASYGFIPPVLDDWKQRRKRRPEGL